MLENPLTALGELSIPFLISNLITLLGFFIAAYLAIKYTQKFYGGRPKPNSWVFIVAGLIIISLSEIGQFLLSYISSPSILEGVVTLVTFDGGIVLIVLGSYLLYRGVQ